MASDFCNSKPDEGEAPTTIKLYINRDSLGFSDAEDIEATQTLNLSPEDLQPGKVSPLKFVKFQRVSSLSVFVEENAGGDATSLSVSVPGIVVNLQCSMQLISMQISCIEHTYTLISLTQYVILVDHSGHEDIWYSCGNNQHKRLEKKP